MFKSEKNWAHIIRDQVLEIRLGKLLGSKRDRLQGGTRFKESSI